METSSKTNDFKPIPPDHRPLVKRNSASALPEERRVTSPILSPYSNDIEFNLSPLESTKKSSIAGATLNFTNSIIGAGIISLPYAISQAGIVLGSVLLIGIAFLVDWTALLLVRAGKLSGQTSYQSIMGVTFGRWGSWSITAFQVIFAFGAMIAYVIIIGDTLPAVFHSLFGTSTSSWFFSRMGFIVMSTVVLLPLSLLNNLNSLSTTSAISLGSIALIILAVMMSVGSVPEGLRGDPNAQLVWFGPAPFKAIGIIAFAFVCHHSTFLIFDSLEIPTLDRFTRVTHYATAISLVFSILLAYLGYFTFVQKTAGNVLNNFPTDNNVINVARFCFALNMLTTFPIECYVACHVLQDYFQIYNRALWAILLVFLSIFIACFVPDVSLILEITGSFSASALAFILPPLLWLKLSNSLKWPCMVCIGFGIVVLIFSLIF